VVAIALPAHYVAPMEPDSPAVPKRTLTEILYVIFLRLVAVACFWFGLQYWAMLVGYSLQGLARFDLLALPWKVAASALAVLFPVASLGLWLTVSWGPVLWTIAAVSQILMYSVWPEIFGTNHIVPLLHGLVAALYVVFRLSLWLETRRKAERVRIDLP
jgi:hypothetical protein